MACDAMLNFAAILTVSMPLEVPKALLGDHYRHRFDLRRCYEAWVPSTCSINVPHGLRDPCSHRSLLHFTNAPASSNEAGARSERRGEAMVASMKDFPIWGAVVSTCRESIAIECICVPFFLRTFPQKFGGTPAPSTWFRSRDPALACTLAS